MATKFTDEEWEEYLKEHQPDFKGDLDHLRILLETGVRGWNIWRKNNPDIKPDLSGVDLELKPRHLKIRVFKMAKESDRIIFPDKTNHTIYFNFGRINLNNTNLENANLSKSTYRGADFSSSNLKKAKFEKADLEDAFFLKADMRGADLYWADLKGAIMNEANLKEALLMYADFDKTIVTDIKYKGIKTSRKPLAVTKGFFGINIESCKGNEAFKRYARDMAYLEDYSRKHPLKYKGWKILCDCGESWLLWSFWSILIASFFAILFYVMGPCHFEPKQLPFSFDTMIYYSVLTFTTFGFGDITPITNIAAFIIMTEVMAGYIMLGGLISIFATKLARRS